MLARRNGSPRWSIVCSLVFGTAASSLFAHDAGAAAVKTTYVYKRVGALEIKADVYRPESVEAGLRPVVVWIHGGGMINGHREGVFRPMHDALVERGCVVVSIDYRLAPESKLPALVSDVEDAFRWIRTDGPKLFAGDPARIGVFGGSAGGYLTLVAGFRVEPRPQALVSLWGYGNVLAPWSSEPSPYPRHQQAKYSPEEAAEQEQAPPIADSRDRKGDGGGYYQYARRTGRWPKALTGWDPKTEAEKFAPYLPVRHVTPDYPPTLLIHGDADTDVAFEESAAMAAELKKHGVEHRLIRFEGAEHGLPGVDKAELAKAYDQAVEFLLRHLTPR